jgi:hypothetical protein
MPGWIKLHRDLIKHPRSGNPQWLALWVHLLSLAAYEDSRAMFKGKVIQLAPGQLVVSRPKLAKITGIPSSTIERFLDVLETEQQIEQQTASTSRLITICNWAKYQERGQRNGQRTDSGRTADGSAIYTIRREEEKKGVQGEADASLVESAKASQPATPEVVKRKKTQKKLTDEEWMASIKATDCYKSINVDHEYQKMATWCSTRNKIPSRQRFVNWLNKADRPMDVKTPFAAGQVPYKPSSVPFGYSTASPDSKTPISEKTAIVSAKELKGALEEETQKELALAVKDEDSVQY